MPFAVICDGEVLEDVAKDAGYNTTDINKMVLSSKLPIEKILIMCVDSDGVSFLGRKGDDQ